MGILLNKQNQQWWYCLYYYYYRDGRSSYFAGLSLPNAIPMNFSYQNNADTSSNASNLFGYTVLQHFSIQGGYRFVMGRDYLDVNAWMKKAITDINNASFPVQWNIFTKYHFSSIFIY